ncbi:MAG: PKD domain-containing protein [Candidatus Krumholzibacteriota bacterium]|nr:PKD domain-containing protein [Candidatus Krumholzibacteriota bacterium]
MKLPHSLFNVMFVFILLFLPVNPLQGADTDGKIGIGLHGGGYKLVLTDHSDMWTPGWFLNADLKYRLTPRFAIGVEGSWMQTYLADLSVGTRQNDGARLTFDNVADGPRQRAYVAGMFAEYHFLPDSRWSPYVSAGSGIYIWKWTDKDWNTLSSDDPALADINYPKVDMVGAPYDLKDQELYMMAGLGLEVFATPSLSFELGAKFRYLTHLLTSFKGDQDIVGSDPGQLDLPKGIAELYAGLTFHFGGKKCPPLTSTISGDPMSGPAPLMVQFAGTSAGGCPDYTYVWNFGDGGTSSEKDPYHTYQTDGDYQASLIVSDSKGTISENSLFIKVKCPKLTGIVSADPASGTVPLTVKFSGSATGGCPGYTYMWNFGDGGTSSENIASHTYQTEGEYSVSLTVTDSKGNKAQKMISIVSSAEKYIPTPEKPIILHGVNFGFDKSKLTIAADDILDQVAASLKIRPDVKVDVVGHCDWTGTEAYNQKLSVRRAEAVRDYLISKGVKAENLTFKGYGETKPMADNNTAEGRALNRRVELIRIK